MSAKELFSLNFLNNIPIVLPVTGLLSVRCKINASATNLCAYDFRMGEDLLQALQT
jgi:hypothetical protein